MSAKLENLKGNTWIIPGPSNIGLYADGKQAWLIDTGNDESSGRKAFKAAQSLGCEVAGIINTHSHSDHFGGNAFITKRTDCRVYASHFEAPMIENRQMEYLYLWNAIPPKSLVGKFLSAQEVKVTDTFEPGEELVGGMFTTVLLDGHSAGQVGVRTPDDVLFIADSVLSADILQKYPVPFVMNYDANMANLKRMRSLEAALFVPSHGTPQLDAQEIIDVNERALLTLREKLLAALPGTRDALLANMARERGSTLNMVQYILQNTTISALLSSLIEEGTVAAEEDTPQGVVFVRA